jgi:hypothetical protein
MLYIFSHMFFCVSTNFHIAYCMAFAWLADGEMVIARSWRGWRAGARGLSLHVYICCTQYKNTSTSYYGMGARTHPAPGAWSKRHWPLALGLLLVRALVPCHCRVWRPVAASSSVASSTAARSTTLVHCYTVLCHAPGRMLATRDTLATHVGGENAAPDRYRNETACFS